MDACTTSTARRRFLLAGASAAWPMALATPAGAGTPSDLPRPRAGADDLLLAGVYAEHIDPAHCLVSEKYDGVRALWDGATLRHRSGRPIAAPTWFTAGLPAQPLDGELWIARGAFDRVSAVVRRRGPSSAEWRDVRFLLFELPHAPGSFAERVARLRAIVGAAGLPHLQAVTQRRVADGAALQRLLDATIAQGGEGLMLHVADATYVSGRSDVLTKLKPHLDAEAVVIGQRVGRGRYAGQVGALEVRTPDGRTFFVGSGLDDVLRRDPPPLGSIVTYRYRDLTPGGTPRFATFVRRHEAL